MGLRGMHMYQGVFLARCYSWTVASALIHVISKPFNRGGLDLQLYESSIRDLNIIPPAASSLIPAWRSHHAGFALHLQASSPQVEVLTHVVNMAKARWQTRLQSLPGAADATLLAEYVQCAPRQISVQPVCRQYRMGRRVRALSGVLATSSFGLGIISA